MAGFNPNDYDTVDSRLTKFWADHPEGRIYTELVHHEGDQYIVRAEAYAQRDDRNPISTGYAEERVATRGVNQTSALENCETSAIGRALANYKYAAKARPSAEEMQKANRGQSNGQAADSAPNARKALAAHCERMGYDLGKVAAKFREKYQQELGEATDPTRVRAFTKLLDGMPELDLKATA